MRSDRARSFLLFLVKVSIRFFVFDQRGLSQRSCWQVMILLLFTRTRKDTIWPARSWNYKNNITLPALPEPLKIIPHFGYLLWDYA